MNSSAAVLAGCLASFALWDVGLYDSGNLGQSFCGQTWAMDPVASGQAVKVLSLSPVLRDREAHSPSPPASARLSASVRKWDLQKARPPENLSGL